MAKPKSLILVESAGKARAIKKFVGSTYQVISTDGLLKDLPKSRIGIDENYAPDYITIRGKGKLLQSLKKETLKAGRIYLATNPDSAGEFLAQQCCQLFGVNEKSNCRIIFDEMTKSVFQDALKNARPIDNKLVDAFQAKQIIDKFVSHKIGEYLSYKIYRGVKVGRFRAMLLKFIDETKPRRILKTPKILTPEGLQELSANILKFSPTKTRLILEQLYEGINFDKDGYSGLIKYPHGAINLTAEIRTPDSVKGFLSESQFKLYELIYSAIDSGKARNFNMYEISADSALMADLDKLGFDWAEVYSVGVNSLMRRKYIIAEEKFFTVTPLGKRVLEALAGFFDEDFSLDAYKKILAQVKDIADGKIDKISVIKDYCEKFNKHFKKAMDSLGEDAKIQSEPAVETEEICDKCGHKMLLKRGRYGFFLACSNYPKCENIKPYVEYLEQKCPKCGGRITKRSFNGGRILYGCENADCDFRTWDEPLDKPCRECGSTMFAHKFKDRPAMIYCGNENCSTRKEHPINKIIEEARRRREKLRKSK